MADNEPAPWDRQDAETGRAYVCFNAYLMLGSQRSLQKAWSAWKAHAPGMGTPTPGHWTQWSVKHDWYQRAVAWDEEQARQQRASLAGEWDGIARTRVSAMRIMLQRGMQIFAKVKWDALDPDEAMQKIGLAVNMMTTATNQLRMESGEDVRRVHVSTSEVDADLEELDDDELAAIVAGIKSRRTGRLDAPRPEDEPEEL